MHLLSSSTLFRDVVTYSPPHAILIQSRNVLICHFLLFVCLRRDVCYLMSSWPNQITHSAPQTTHGLARQIFLRHVVVLGQCCSLRCLFNNVFTSVLQSNTKLAQSFFFFWWGKRSCSMLALLTSKTAVSSLSSRSCIWSEQVQLTLD